MLKCTMIWRKAGVALLTIAAPALLWAGPFSYTGSVGFSTGDYLFTEPTSSFYLSNGLVLNTGRFTLSAEIPVVLQTTPWLSYSAIGYIPSGGDQNRMIKKGIHQGKITLPETSNYDQIGLGDPTVFLSYVLFQEGISTPSLSVTGNLKIPIAAVDHGFGTGEWDYGFGGSVGKTFTTTMVMLDASYWIIGDMPDLELKDTFLYSLSVGRLYRHGRVGVMGSFSGSSRTIEGTDPPLQIGLGVNHNTRPGQAVTLSVMIGLTQTAPDFALAFGWRLGL